MSPSWHEHSAYPQKTNASIFLGQLSVIKLLSWIVHNNTPEGRQPMLNKPNVPMWKPARIVISSPPVHLPAPRPAVSWRPGHQEARTSLQSPNVPRERVFLARSLCFGIFKHDEIRLLPSRMGQPSACSKPTYYHTFCQPGSEDPKARIARFPDSGKCRCFHAVMLGKQRLLPL